MKSDSTILSNYALIEPVVIADECGDSLWDDVLKQEVASCEMKDLVTNAPSLLNRITAVQASDTTGA